MRIIETNHFSSRWNGRVGESYQGVRKKIVNCIKNGEHRRKRSRKFGLLIPIVTRCGKTVYVIGTPNWTDNREELVLKTVLDEDAATLQWTRH